MILCQDCDGMVSAVRLQICGFVGQRILAPQFVLYLRERIGYVRNLEGKEWTSATCIGNSLQNFVAFVSGSNNVRADGVDDYLGALCHVDRFLARDMTLIIVAI